MIKKFSLLELLIVVAIIGILTTLLLPSLSKAREKAAQAVCLSNQKQCGIALLSYGTVYTSIMALDHNNNSGKEAFWSGKLYETVFLEESATINKCPSFPPYNSDSVALSLGINVRSWTGDNNVRNDIKDIVDNDYYYIRHQRIDTPKEFIFLVDSTTIAGTTQAHKAVSASNGTSGPHVRHGGKANTLFADGHAKAISHGRLIHFGFQYGRLQDGTHW